MAITRPKRESRAVEAFAEAAPDARPVAKLRGKKKLFAMTLPPDLIEEVTEMAQSEGRSRANMIEFVLRRAVQEYRMRRAA